MRKYTPADAMALLRSRDTIEHACDVVKNGAFAKASATTRDAFGRRVLDSVGSAEGRRIWPDQLAALFAMPIEQFEARMTLEPVRRSHVPKPNGGSRDIGIPTFLRRCVSNALNDVLAVTSDGVLPDCVRAYRRGRDNAVQEAILDVAEAVYDGRVRFFAKLDIRSYFSEMPWPAIENALLQHGYDQEFVARVMAAVKCPVVRNEHGHLVTEPTSKGAQMGLAESSVLANLVLFALDEELGVRNRRLVYLRYSDDLFVGAVEKHEVIAAVRRVASWCREHGMQLKDVEHNARLANLVRDVKKSKIALLGAEVDHLGYVHMPGGKLQAKLGELAYLQERIASDSAKGVSRYGDGGGADVYDAGDLHRSKQAFLDYWSALDPRGTARARLIMERRFPSTSVPSDTERGTVWIARLWGNRTDRAGGSGRAVHDPNGRSEDGLPQPSRMSPFATGDGATADAACELGLPPGRHASSGTHPTVPVPTSASSEVADGGVFASLMEELSIDSGDSWVVGDSSHTVEEDASRSSAERRKSYRFDTLSLVDPDSYIDPDSKLTNLESTILTTGGSWGAMSDPTDGASPPRSVFENAQVQFVHAASVRVGTERVVVVGRCEIVRGFCRNVDVHVVRKCRAEAALVRQLTTEVRSSRQASITLVMTPTWLVKSLLQPKRRFRAPLLFGHVLELHESARGRSVVLAAGMETPEPLVTAMNARLDELLRQAARRHMGDQRPAALHLPATAM